MVASLHGNLGCFRTYEHSRLTALGWVSEDIAQSKISSALSTMRQLQLWCLCCRWACAAVCRATCAHTEQGDAGNKAPALQLAARPERPQVARGPALTSTLARGVPQSSGWQHDSVACVAPPGISGCVVSQGSLPVTGSKQSYDPTQLCGLVPVCQWQPAATSDPLAPLSGAHM